MARQKLDAIDPTMLARGLVETAAFEPTIGADLAFRVESSEY